MTSKWRVALLRSFASHSKPLHSFVNPSIIALRASFLQFSQSRTFSCSRQLFNGTEQLPLGLYLWKRIRQTGAKSVMGLPGDMNLELLHYMKDADLHWVGNSNELNAAYAADGYSRIAGSPGILLTTMAVGELSAINGIAGSYSENVKIIHVVAATGKKAQENRVVMHHTLGDSPDHRIYEKMSAPVRVAHCYLDDEKVAVAEIDRVIYECHIHSRPVYIYVPVDMVHKPVSSNQLPQTAALEAVSSAISSSKNPIILVDSHVIQFNAKAIVRDLADLLQFPVFCPFMGKSIIDESKPYFYGTYNGNFSYPGVQKAVEEDSDLVVHLGPFPTDMNTGGYTAKVDSKKLISVEETKVKVKGEIFEPVYLKSFLTSLLSLLSNPPSLPTPQTLTLPPPPLPSDANNQEITQPSLYPLLASYLKDGDTLFADGGTTHFGLQDATFPDLDHYVMQNHWASIGFATPAAFGGALARRDLGLDMGKRGKTVLITGEGAMQLSVQEVGTMVREGVGLVIFIINNGGYSIERCVIHPDAYYHDIATWDHRHMLSFFGLKDGEKRTHQVRTNELKRVLGLEELRNPQGVHVVEVFVDKMDWPWRLKAFGEAYRSMKGK